MKTIAIGAEATIMRDGNEIVKRRDRKGYRINELDSVLRSKRSKQEFSIMQKCFRAGLAVPMPISLSDDGYSIRMGFIDGMPLAFAFDAAVMPSVGVEIARMHGLGIVHGDLTTANVMLANGRAYIIDFGLGFFSSKDEDRATDLFIMKNALKSKHPSEHETAYTRFLDAYKETIGKEFKGVKTHLRDIELRGRYHENG